MVGPRPVKRAEAPSLAMVDLKALSIPCTCRQSQQRGKDGSSKANQMHRVTREEKKAKISKG